MPWTTGPTDEASCVNWVSPRDAGTVTVAGGLLSDIQDKDASNHDYVQATGSLQPGLGARSINGNLVMDFDGSDDYIRSIWTLAQPFTVIAVVQSDTTSLTHFFIGNHSSQNGMGIAGALSAWYMNLGSSFEVFGGTIDTNPHYVVFIADGASSSIRVDGVEVATGDAGTGTLGFSTSMRIGGASSARYWDGGVGDLAVFNAALSGTPLADAEAWLDDLVFGAGAPLEIELPSIDGSTPVTGLFSIGPADALEIELPSIVGGAPLDGLAEILNVVPGVTDLQIIELDSIDGSSLPEGLVTIEVVGGGGYRPYPT